MPEMTYKKWKRATTKILRDIGYKGKLVSPRWDWTAWRKYWKEEYSPRAAVQDHEEGA